MDGDVHIQYGVQIGGRFGVEERSGAVYIFVYTMVYVVAI